MALTEVQGSRKEQIGHKISDGVMMFVGAAAADAPALNGVGGTANPYGFFRIPGATAEEGTGITHRRAFHNNIDVNTLPGIAIITTHYRKFQIHS